MELATLQRELRTLVKGRADARPPSDDPYILAVAQSPYLRIVRTVALNWLTYTVERTCPLSCRALAQRGLFDTVVEAFTRREISPYAEEQASTFLEEQGRHADPLVASVAQFERALTRVKQGDPGTYLVDWDREPYGVLLRLMSNHPLDGQSSGGAYRTIVSRDLPDLFVVVAPD